MKRFISIFLFWGLLISFNTNAQENNQLTGDQNSLVYPNLIKKPIAFEITGPLRDNPIVFDHRLDDFEFMMNAHRDREINPNIQVPDFNNMPKDPAVQYKSGWKMPETKALLKNFAGQNSGSYPPDANGTVGQNYYFQVVNTTYAIYDKNTEAIVAGPSPLNSIFNSSLPGANCNNGDPIVLWDEHANRWFYAEFSLCGATDYMLIAISQTSDPTGSWYSWSFDVDDTPDYMKFGIWQDGYYMATNTSSGNDVYVFERDVMIAGGPSPTMIGFDNPNRPSTFDGFHCILPLDNDGAWAPSGTPGQFITIADDGQSNPADQLWIYEMDVDWVTPANTTFSRTQTLNVNAFSGNFTGNWNNIPQQGTTQKLDGLSTILMYRAQYRNFSGDQRLVIAHAIAESSSEAAMRWYELVNTGSGWSIRQQSTYNPDNISRWNMSIAMNGNKEIGIGYSVSNSSMNPGIRYIGQSTSANTAANNTLDMAETVIWNGSYSQSSYNRWGDYCNISVDPSDDHTFWYTNEYMGSSTHGTRIASFEFSTPASPPVANFSADNLFPVPGQSVQFTDLSTNTPTSWAWSFSPATITYQGGTDANTQNPQVSFDNPGYYTVTLTATNAFGSDDETKVDYIYAGPCSEPSNLDATGITNTSAQLSWTAGGGETQWNIEYGLQGFTQGTGTVISGVSNPYTLTGLTDATSYDYYVQANCGDGYTSGWVGPFTFTTTDCIYCYAWGNTNFETSTTRVIFNTIDKSSAKPTDGNGNAYSDYTNISTDIARNQSYDLRTFVNTDGNFWVYVRAWIDWNQDCDFDDTGEEYDLGRVRNTSDGETNNSPLSLIVPLDAKLGSTRLRVISKYYSYPTSCFTDFDGEVEDYTLNIKLCDPNITTTWNGANWSDGTPDEFTTAIINGNYTTTTNFTCCSMIVNSGNTITIPAGEYIEITDNVDMNGTLEVANEGSIVQWNDDAVNTGSGTYRIHKSTRPYTEYDYTFWSSPVPNETVLDAFINNSSLNDSGNTGGTTNASQGSPPDRIYWFDTANFNDDNPVDHFDDEFDDWIPTTGSMTPGKGYIAMGAGADFPFDTSFADHLVQSVFFEDTAINNGEVTFPLVFDNSDTDNFDNENLVGNPYPSAIDLQTIYNDPLNNPGGNPVISSTVQFWSHDTNITAGGGPWAYNFTIADYAIYNIATDIGTASNGGAGSLAPTRYWASCQSVFLEALQEAPLYFNNGMRELSNNDTFFKSKEQEKDAFWLNMTQNNGLFRQIALVFLQGGDDSVNQYDSDRAPLIDEPDFYSLAPNSNDRLIIQGLAPFKMNKIIPLGLETQSPGVYQINLSKTQGVFSDTQKVYLKDKKTNSLVELDANGYSFTILDDEVGINNDRFEVHFIDNTTVGLSETILTELSIYPNPSSDLFYFNWNSFEKLKVEVYNSQGQHLKTEWMEAGNALDMKETAAGIYYCVITSGKKQIQRKLIVR